MNNLKIFHNKHRKYATVTAVKPIGRFGALALGENEHVSEFVEKPKGDGVWINGGYFVLEQDIFDLIDDDLTIWEQDPMINLTREKQLVAYKHYGFWRPMDTMSDKRVLEELWRDNNAPWKVW